jgi:hypothetical protein
MRPRCTVSTRYWLLALLVGGALSAPAVAAESGPEVAEIQACVQRNVPQRSSRQVITLRTTEPGGGGEEIRAALYWKRSKQGRSRFLIRVEAPADLRGAAFLLIEGKGQNDLFTYLPELHSVRRITSRTVGGSLFGTDFSYEDIQELQSVAEHTTVERLPDAEVLGRPVYVLAARPPADAGSAYERIVSSIDRERCVLVKAELFAKGGAIAKELVLPPDHVEQDGTRWVPREARLRDLENGGQTALSIDRIENDVDLRESLFSEVELAKGH